MSALKFNDVATLSDDYGSLDIGAKYFLPGLSVNFITYKFSAADPVILRPIPYFSNGEELPSVVDHHGELKTGNWMLPLPCIEYAGSASKLSCVCFDPFEEKDGNYDAATNPYIVLYRQARRAAGQKLKIGNVDCENWAGFFTGKEAILPSFKRRAFIQALVYTDGERILIDPKTGLPSGLQPGDETLGILKLSTTAAKAMINETLSLYRESGLDAFRLAACHYAAIYNEATASVSDVDFDKWVATSQQYQDNPAGVVGFGGGGGTGMEQMFPGAGGFSGNDDDDISRYDCSVVRRARLRYTVKTNGRKDTKAMPLECYDLTPWKGEILRRWKPWNSLIHIHSDQELAVMIARAFADKATMLRFAWSDLGIITNEIDGILKSRKTVAMGAAELDDDVNRAQQQWSQASATAWGQPQQHYGQPQNSQQGQPTQGQPTQGQPTQGQPQNPQQGYPQLTQGQPQNPQQGYPQPMQGQPMQGQPMQGQPMQGQPMQGQPMQGQPMQGQPAQNYATVQQPYSNLQQPQTVDMAALDGNMMSQPPRSALPANARMQVAQGDGLDEVPF